MMPKVMVISFLALVYWSGGALAQTTVGDLVDAKAVRLSPEQVTATVSGAVLSGPTESGGSSEIRYKADGTFEGTYQNSTFTSARGTSGATFGTWTVSPRGALCRSGTNAKNNKAIETCAYLYRLADRLFVAGNTKRESQVLERTVKRP